MRWPGRPSSSPSAPRRASLARSRNSASVPTRWQRRHARLATGASLLIQLCLGVAVTAVLATGVAAVHAHHIGQVMVAVLPLAALATFETVPAVPLAVARALEVRAAARRLFALEDVPVPVRDPVTPLPPAGGVPEVVFTGASLRYGLRPSACARRGEHAAAGWRAGRRDRVEWRRQVEPRHRVAALLATRGRHTDPWCHRRGRSAPGRRPSRLRAGRPAGADVRRDRAVQPRTRPARRHRRGDQ